MSLDLRARLQSFAHALRGGATLLRTQPNARLHLLATVLVVIAAAALRVQAGEWLALIAVIG